MDTTPQATPPRPGGKIESLPKEELLKFIRKQAMNGKELKKKIEEQNESLKKAHEELHNLENEKKEWLSHGILAEFDKKDKITKKDQELQLAAQLGKEMLAENDDLHGEINDLQHQHDDTVQSYEDELDKLYQEKDMLETALQSLQEKYKSAKQEALDCKEALEEITKPENQKTLPEENNMLKEKIKGLEEKLLSHTSNIKFQNMKEKYDDLVKENKTNKEARITIETESKSRVERLVAVDQEMKILRKEIAEYQKAKRADKLEADALRSSNNELTKSFNDSEAKVKELDDELQKVKADKEKQLKAYKIMKTKFERASQMEEELKKQLNIIVNERDELMKKSQKRNNVKKGKGKSPRELEDQLIEKDTVIQELESQIIVFDTENSELQKRVKILTETNDTLHERYQNLHKDFDSLSFEIDELTATKHSHVEEKETWLAEKVEYETSYKKLQEDFNQVQIENGSNSAQCLVLEAELKTVKEKLQELESCNKNLSEKNKLLSMDLKKLEEEKKKQAKTVKGKKVVKKETQTSVKNVKMSSQETQCDNLQEEFEQHLKENQTLEKTLEEIQTEVEMYRSKAPETTTTILKLEARIDELFNQLQTLNEEKLNQELELEELFKSHDDLQNKYDFECQERERKENEIHSLEERLAKLEIDKKEGKEESMLDLEQQLSHHEESLKDLSAQNHYYQQEILVKEECIVQLRNEIEELGRKQSESNTANNKEVDKIFSEYDELDNKFKSTTEELEKTFKENKSCHLLISELETEKKKIVDTLSITGQKLFEMKQKLDEKTAECDQVRPSYIDLDNKLARPTEDVTAEKKDDAKEVEMTDIENAKLKEEVKSLKTDLERFEEEYKQTMSNNILIEQNVEKVISSKSELQTLFESLNIEFEFVKGENNSLQEKINCYQKINLKANCKDADELLLHIVTIEESVLANEQEITKLNEDLLMKEEIYKDVFNKIQNNDEQKVDLENQLSSIQNQLDEKITLVDTLNKDVEELTLKVHESTCVDTESVGVNTVAVSINTKSVAVNTEFGEFVYEEKFCASDEPVFVNGAVNTKSMAFDTKPVAVNTEFGIYEEKICARDGPVNIAVNTETVAVNTECGAYKEETLCTNNESINVVLEFLKEEIKIKADLIVVLYQNIEELKIENKVGGTLDDDAAIPSHINANVIAEKEEEIIHLQEELEKVKEAFNQAHIETKHLKTLEENYLNEIQERNILISRLKAESEALKKSLEDFSLEIVEVKGVCNELRFELLEKDASILQLSEKATNFENVIEKLQTLICDKDSTICELSENNKKSDLFIASLKLEFTECTEKYTQFESMANELQSLVLEKEKYIVDLTEKIEKLKTQSADLKTDKAEVLEKCQLLENENLELVNEIKTKEIDIKHLQVIIEEKVQLLTSLKALSKQNDRIEIIEELEQYKVSQQQIEEELQSALNKVDELENSLKEKRATTDNLETLIKDKTEKGQKLRNVALKAKKELESMRTQFQEVKKGLEQQVSALMEEVKLHKTGLVRQKTECGKHEEEFEEMQKEISSLEEQLENQKSSTSSIREKNEELLLKIERLTVNLSSYENKTVDLIAQVKESEKVVPNLKISKESLKKCEEKLCIKEKECEELNIELEKLRTTLGDAHKETQQVEVMNLEIVDYQRTIENLQKKLTHKEKLLDELQLSFEQLKESNKTLEKDIDLIKKEKQESKERNRKFKTLVVKLKRQIEDHKNEQEESNSIINGLNAEVEKTKQSNDEMKINLGKLEGEKSALLHQMKTSNEIHERSYQSLEVKYARMSTDLISAQRVYQELQQEYENYKVRAHNVLKQQKAKKDESHKEADEHHRLQLEDIIDKLKLKLEEADQQLNILRNEYTDLELGHEQLQTRHNQFVQEISEKETGWKNRFEQIKADMSVKILEKSDKIKLLTKENEILLLTSKEHSEMVSADQELHAKEVTLLKEQIQKLQTLRNESHLVVSLNHQESSEARSDSSHLSLDLSKSVSERQEGEGMDQKELELIDTLSQQSSSVPHTPLSPSNAFVLEKILTPIESHVMSSPQTPGSTREELANLKSSLNTTRRKNEHMTGLLRESEANASRLTEQAKVLKEEIRRLERNEQREQALSNMEYLKNVIIKFLKVGPVEKEQLIPVLCTMLKLSTEERQFIGEFAKGENADGGDDNTTWSSYVYRWTSLS